MLTYYILVFAISWGGILMLVAPGGIPGEPEDVARPFSIHARSRGGDAVSCPAGPFNRPPARRSYDARSALVNPASSALFKSDTTQNDIPSRIQ